MSTVTGGFPDASQSEGEARMAHGRISLRELATDIVKGLDDTELMEKYGHPIRFPLDQTCLPRLFKICM